MWKILTLLFLISLPITHNANLHAYPIGVQSSTPILQKLETQGIRVECPSCSSSPVCTGYLNNTGLIIVARGTTPLAVIYPNATNFTIPEQGGRIIPIYRGEITTYEDSTPYTQYLACIQKTTNCTLPKVSRGQIILLFTIIYAVMFFFIFYSYRGNTTNNSNDSFSS